ncbi:MAG: hypothetical protein CM15mV25_1610 [uncultured marine virus]|nr:MAG: hypothetical protein CM15mV25_1610 [uncultured marine virus]
MRTLKDYIIFAVSLTLVITFTKMSKAEVPGLTDDLSGNTVPVKEVKVSSTVDKTIEVLEKIERVEKQKIKFIMIRSRLLNQQKSLINIVMSKLLSSKLVITSIKKKH